MLIRTIQSIRFSYSFHADHSLDNYFLQNDVQLWCPHIFIEGAPDTSPKFQMRLLLGVLLPDQHTSRKCLGCKVNSESQKNVTLGIPFLQVMVKKKQRKKQPEEAEKQQHVIVT